MNEKCLGCFGSGRFGASRDFGKSHIAQVRCFRCKGSGLEPIDDLLYVAAINRRVKGLAA